MRRILFLVINILLIVDISAAEYKILKLNTETIKIGNKICRKDSVFNDTWPITWTSTKQCMTVQNVKERTISYLSGAAMQSQNTKTVKDYLLHNAHLMGKDGEHWLSLSALNGNDYIDRRIALVIGNSNYNNYTKLENPLNDVTAVSEQLQQIGFEVISLYDATNVDMKNALD